MKVDEHQQMLDARTIVGMCTKKRKKKSTLEPERRKKTKKQNRNEKKKNEHWKIKFLLLNLSLGVSSSLSTYLKLKLKTLHLIYFLPVVGLLVVGFLNFAPGWVHEKDKQRKLLDDLIFSIPSLTTTDDLKMRHQNHIMKSRKNKRKKEGKKKTKNEKKRQKNSKWVIIYSFQNKDFSF